MKKITIISAICAAATLLSCSDDNFNIPVEKNQGYLSFEGLTISYDDGKNEVASPASTRVVENADDSYMVYLYDTATDNLVWEKNYGTIKTEITASAQNGISLAAGNYRMEVRSQAADVPVAKFSTPVYGVTKTFSITAGKTTTIDTILCTLVQCAATVEYNDDFLAMVTGDGATSIEVTAGYPLEYALTYKTPKPSYEHRIGFFAVNNGAQTTMSITFKGQIDGKSQRMTTAIKNIQPRDWHIIKFIKKVDSTGNVSFAIQIDDLIEDIPLTTDVIGEENGDGNDPNAPQGDGGIDLISTSTYDISQEIVVPTAGNPFNFTAQAIIPNGARKFLVKIESTNADFMNSVNTVGGNILDLIYPTEESLGIFDIVPFPHGKNLLNATTIDFDLAGAQTPILAFPGKHTFTMMVTDNKGCKKNIDIVLVVE